MKTPLAIRLPKNRINDAPVVTSLEENDAYKDSMRQVMLHRQPGAQARYEFVCRNTPLYPLAELLPDVNRELDHLCTLTYSDKALEFKRTQRYLASDYIDFLALFRYQRRFIHAEADGDQLRIWAEGPQVHVMGFEIHVLNIVSELYFRRFEQEPLLEEGRKRLQAKLELLKAFREEVKASPRRNPFEFFDFGLRRRFSGAWHREVVETLLREAPDFFKGTSNVLLARELGLVAIGTQAHEYYMSFMGYPGVALRDFQKVALETWLQEYRGELGVALTDCIGMDAFCEDFDRLHALSYEGLRHDSGDPYVWGEKAIKLYGDRRVDVSTKRMTWSDGLDLERSFGLWRYFADRTKTGFGIGTNLSNDMGIPPLNLVMKLMTCNGKPVAKLSDAPGKTLCKDATFLAYLRDVFNKPE